MSRLLLTSKSISWSWINLCRLFCITKCCRWNNLISPWHLLTARVYWTQSSIPNTSNTAPGASAFRGFWYYRGRITPKHQPAGVLCKSYMVRWRASFFVHFGELYSSFSQLCTAHLERVSTYYNMYILVQSRDAQGRDAQGCDAPSTHVPTAHVLYTGGAAGKM